MSSLRDQLLKAGLAPSKPQSKKTKKKKAPKVAKKDRPTVAAKVSDETRRVQQAMIKKAKRDRELNKQREAEKERRSQEAQITKWITDSKFDRHGGEEKFNFTIKRKVKSIYVTDAQRMLLSEGKASVVKVPNGGLEAIPLEVSKKIATVLPKFVIYTAESSDNNEAAADDPYADYQVPDDLTW